MLDRRGFLKGLASALAGFTILPGADRLWVARTSIVTPVKALRTVRDLTFEELADLFAPRPLCGEESMRHWFAMSQLDGIAWIGSSGGGLQSGHGSSFLGKTCIH